MSQVTEPRVVQIVALTYCVLKSEHSGWRQVDFLLRASVADIGQLLLAHWIYLQPHEFHHNSKTHASKIVTCKAHAHADIQQSGFVYNTQKAVLVVASCQILYLHFSISGAFSNDHSTVHLLLYASEQHPTRLQKTKSMSGSLAICTCTAASHNVVPTCSPDKMQCK